MKDLVQVKRGHYDFTRYVKPDRWNSYYMQIKEICEHLSSTGGKVLLIGVGDGIVPYLLERIVQDIRVTTVDYAADLFPDIACDIRDLSKYILEKYDVILCCQVLEHLKFEEFGHVLSEFRKCIVQGGKLIISLPDSGILCAINISIPKFHIKNYIRKWCRWYKNDFEFNGEHYWEVNSAGRYSNKKIRKIIECYFKLEKVYLVPNNTYHRFYVACYK